MTVAAELASALGEPEALSPLAGGAGRCEMWAATVAGRPVVYRRYPEGLERDVVRPREWDVLALAREAGVPVPEPLALTPAGIVVERVAGEARPRPLLTDDRWARARSVLVARVADAAARLHAIEPPPGLPLEPEMEQGETTSDLDGLPAGEAAVVVLERHLDRLGEPHPAVELGLRWLRLHPPTDAPPAIVHGDFRLSNLVVAEDGTPALIDWELVHVGDGAEDLGWMCMRSWRFGSPLPALGCGTREELLDAYIGAGGRAVTPEELHWWEVCANARWAVICLLQADRHLSGVDRSIERAMIGRRTCEAEWDLLALLAGDRPPPAAVPTPQDRPDGGELLETVAEYLRDLRSRAPADDTFALAVAANACRVVARELPPDGPAARERFAQRAAALRSGAHDAELDALVDQLRAEVRAKLEVANPRWIG